MRIEKEYIINDEPWISTSTGKRKINLIYTGPQFLYAEVDNLSHVLAITHICDSGPELQIAMEKLTPIEGRSIVQIDAAKSTLAASHFWNCYKFSIENYVENLPNGQTYTHTYSEEPQLSEIYDFNKMDFDKNKADFVEYKFITAPVTDSVMLESIDTIISKVNLAKTENQSLTSENKVELDKYISDLNKFKSDMASGIPNWKMPFPTCSIPY